VMRRVTVVPRYGNSDTSDCCDVVCQPAV